MSSLARPGPETSAAFQVPAPVPTGELPPVTLKGTAKGLEIQVNGAPSVEEIADGLTALLAEAPAFFAGNRARVAVDGPLPRGALARLEDVATRFDLTLTEIGPRAQRAGRGTETGAVVVSASEPSLAQGSVPTEDDAEIVDLILEDLEDETQAAIDTMPVQAAVDAPFDAALLPPGPRIVVGPIRSGVSLEYPGHVVIMGDVNPGAQVSARGNIVVLGRMRGIAHAGVDGDSGFILALCLEPQQLRVGRLVARAGADDGPGEGVEIAYVTGKTIVVERYQGRLPTGLAASM